MQGALSWEIAAQQQNPGDNWPLWPQNQPMAHTHQAQHELPHLSHGSSYNGNDSNSSCNSTNSCFIQGQAESASVNLQRDNTMTRQDLSLVHTTQPNNIPPWAENCISQGLKNILSTAFPRMQEAWWDSANISLHVPVQRHD
jgi:hypothetical protein